MLMLASSSPRRAELLRAVHWPFHVVPTNCEEATNGCNATALAVENARRKAFGAQYHGAFPILAADTVVYCEEDTEKAQPIIYGKPKDTADALRMLKNLQGRAHCVVTGIALLWQEKIHTAHAITKVHVEPLTERAIQQYIATGEPMDKAGAYGIQGRAAAFIGHIEGSYSNVVGLPLATLRQLFEKVGFNAYEDEGEGFTIQ